MKPWFSILLSVAMESAALPYDPSSPDVPVKRAHRPRSRSPDDKEQQVYIRFLVSNVAAGCIIGKGGCTITEFQLLSGTRIQLSRNQEFFPGTSERIIMISGVLDDIMKAMELILNKLLSEAEDSNDAESRLKVRLVVPNNSCGAIIGKGGSTIKSFIEDSQAGIKVALLDHNFVGLNDRLITLSGSIEEQLRAIFLILSRLTEDALYLQSIVSPYPYTGVSFSSIHGIPVGYVIPSTSFDTINCGLNCLGSRHPINKGIAPSVTSTRPPAWMPEGQGNSKMIGVADKCIGAVVGLGGRNITEISQATGARIKISSRGDFISGTSDRKVMITGSNEAIQKAEAMIMHKADPSL